MAKITDYRPLPNNPNKGTQKGVGAIEQSVRQLGAGRSILVDKDGVIIAGNHAQEAFVNAGIDDVIEVETDGTQIVVVKRTDMTADSAAGKKMAIMDNRSSELGLSWDDVVVEQMIDDIAQEDGEIDRWLEELAGDVGIELNDGAGTDTEPEIDRAEELREKWGVETGQMWQLGEHRIICGDCTDKAVVERLMGGEKAQMCWTDPPWNVNYGEKLGKGNAQGYKVRKIENDNLGDSFGAFVNTFVETIASALEGGAPIYIKMSAQEWPTIDRSLRYYFHWSSTIIWVKDRLVLSRKDYHTQYEPLWYGWKDGAARLCDVVDRKQSDVWNFERPSKSEEHPTMTPVPLIERSVENSSHVGIIVFEPFVGSGSTIIACENLHRKCRAVEISPAYVAVAIERWHQHTGQMPELME